MNQISINIEQGPLTIAYASYEFETAKINYQKLSETLTKAVFKRVDAHKSGIKTGIKLSKPFNLTIMINKQITLNLEDIAATVGMENQLKVNTSLYKKDPSAAKHLFQTTVLYAFDAHNDFQTTASSVFS